MNLGEAFELSRKSFPEYIEGQYLLLALAYLSNKNYYIFVLNSKSENVDVLRPEGDCLLRAQGYGKLDVYEYLNDLKMTDGYEVTTDSSIQSRMVKAPRGVNLRKGCLRLLTELIENKDRDSLKVVLTESNNAAYELPTIRGVLSKEFSNLNPPDKYARNEVFLSWVNNL